MDDRTAASYRLHRSLPQRHYPHQDSRFRPTPPTAPASIRHPPTQTSRPRPLTTHTNPAAAFHVKHPTLFRNHRLRSKSGMHHQTQTPPQPLSDHQPHTTHHPRTIRIGPSNSLPNARLLHNRNLWKNVGTSFLAPSLLPRVSAVNRTISQSAGLWIVLSAGIQPSAVRNMQFGRTPLRVNKPRIPAHSG